MTMPRQTLAQARDTVDALLRQLLLDAYLFEVEPRNDHWQVRIDCATDGGWQSFDVELAGDELAACAGDAAARAALLERWRARLSACRRP